jgi:MoxR-like ATPase
MIDEPLDDAGVSVYTIGDDGMWPTLRDAGQIRIGFSGCEQDLQGIKSANEVRTQCGIESSGNDKGRLLFKFASEVEEGDILIANGSNFLKGIGVVRSEYEFEENPSIGDSSDTHYRWVGWLDLTFDGEWEGIDVEETGVTVVSGHTGLVNRTEKYPDYRSAILDYIDDVGNRSAIFFAEKIESIKKEAVARHLGYSSYETDKRSPVQTTNLFRNAGGQGDFKDNLDRTVGQSLSSDQRETIREHLLKAPNVKSETLQLLESENTTIWGTKGQHVEEYAVLDRGDWVLHDVSGTIEYVQRVDHSLGYLPENIRSNIAEEISGSRSFSGLWISSAEIHQPDEDWLSIEDRLADTLKIDGEPLLFDSAASMFNQFNPFPIKGAGGGKTVLEEIFPDKEFSDPEVKYDVSEGDLPLPQRNPGVSAISDYDLPEDQCFVLLPEGGGYEDTLDEVYHFESGIPGYSQLESAGAGTTFVYLRKDSAGQRVFDSVGTIETIREESRTEDDSTTDYYAEIDEFERLPPIPFDVIEPYLSKNGLLNGPGIHKVTPQDLRLILQWHDGPLEETLAEIDETDRPDLYKEALVHLVAGRNLALYGPPGTGKTHTAKQLSKLVCGSEDDIELATANAEWTNYEIAGGIQPTVSDDGDRLWEPEPGILTSAVQDCESHLETEGRPAWLIIDELNRANLDQAFGDVFTLLDLDYRSDLPITYAGKDQYVPLSFRILATMNTHDLAKLFSLGYAFRRRFAFVRVPSLLSNATTIDLSDVDTGGVTAHDALSLIDDGEVRSTITDVARDRVERTAADDRVLTEAPDEVTIFPQLAVPERIDEALNAVTEGDLDLEGDDFIESLVAFARYVDKHAVLELGQAVIMDAVTFVLAHELLFPGETDADVVDRAARAYIVPQFEHILGDLRRAETLGENEELAEHYTNAVGIAAELGLQKTARALKDAKDSNSILE